MADLDEGIDTRALSELRKKSHMEVFLEMRVRCYLTNAAVIATQVDCDEETFVAQAREEFQNVRAEMQILINEKYQKARAQLAAKEVSRAE